ncbi:uncharacterized protein CEXT_644431 [Caerostris extrusa]|uniref:Uncharacterized protein n=1 Tax=Caerostris extrusa TaxID=172846 RepID=A0AAV4URD9_CAEEX|nr:uncharacterized protein CEXT_644431 [Caerostris extrusa]
MEVKELQVRMQRCQKETIHQLEAETLDLQSKSKRLHHELELKHRTLQHNEEQYKDMLNNCNTYFENEPTEYHSMQAIHQRIRKRTPEDKQIHSEFESAESVFKQMKEKLEKNHLANGNLLTDVEREWELQEKEAVEQDAAREQIVEKPNEIVSGSPKKKGQVIFTILMLKIVFRANGNRRKIDGSEKKKARENTLDLKTEKKQLDSRMELLRGTNAGCPKRELEEELQIADSRLKEQEKRKESAQLESEKINALLLNLEGQMRKLLQLIRKELPDAKISIPTNPTVAELSLKIEETLKKRQERQLSVKIQRTP